MSKLKKLLASLLAVAMLASMGTVVMASEVGDSVTSGVEMRSLYNCPNCRSSISTTRTPQSNYKQEYINYTWVTFQEVQIRYFCSYCGFGSTTSEWVRV